MGSFGDWLDEICVTIGVTEQKQIEQDDGSGGGSGMQQAIETVQNAVADAKLETGLCGEGHGYDDGGDDHGGSTQSEALYWRAQDLQTRMNAITRRVHRMIANDEQVEGRPTDPVVISLNQRQQRLGAEVSQMINNWDRLGTSGQFAHVSALSGRIGRLECDVSARRM